MTLSYIEANNLFEEFKVDSEQIIEYRTVLIKKYIGIGNFKFCMQIPKTQKRVCQQAILIKYYYLSSLDEEAKRTVKELIVNSFVKANIADIITNPAILSITDKIKPTLKVVNESCTDWSFI